MELDQSRSTSWLERPLTAFLPKPNMETVLVLIVLVMAVLSRFIGLGDRVMSHDEVNHVVPTYSLYRGLGYQYDPVTHGPLQFHMMGLSYFLLGDSDFSSRAPDALVSVITILAVLFLFRRYLGRTGALIAGFLYVISPYMMFYGRYTRNEVYGGLWTVLLLYGVLRYLEKGDRFSLYLLTVVMALHATDKATSFIYTAQMLFFLVLLFVAKVTSLPWKRARRGRWGFSILVGMAILLVLVALGYAVANATPAADANTAYIVGLIQIALIVWVLICVAGAGIVLFVNLGWKVIRAQRTFDLAVLCFTLILPQLAAFPVRMLGWDPLDYSTNGMLHTLIILVPFSLLAIVIGMVWKPRFWPVAAAIYYAIFTVFFTTFFTNGKGFFMGLVAALGYWLSQQGVQRGSQPLYYYALVQIPMYEYLAALGAILALFIAMRRNLFSQVGGFAPANQPETAPAAENNAPLLVESGAPPTAELEDHVTGFAPVGGQVVEDPAALVAQDVTQFALPGTSSSEDPAFPAVQKAAKVPVVALLLFWSITSLVAYSLAGEKMPWLTVHIAGSMLLASGWALGYLVDTTPWKKILNRTGVVAFLLLPVVITSLMGLLTILGGNNPPFRGNEVAQLEATSTFSVSLVLFLASFGGLLWQLKDWYSRNVTRLLVLTFFAYLAVLTGRAAFTASFINYDLANEFLVYAHAARGPKDILAQIEDISRRTTRGKDIVIAYDNESNYPFWWYLRDYPNKRFFADKPTREQLDAPLIVAGDVNYGKIEPLVKDNYIEFEYMRLWWPMQDYMNLTPERIWNAISNPSMRQAIFNIWLNRDYALYAQVNNIKSLTLENWSPAAKEKLYIRKDILAQLWNYGAAPSAPAPAQPDPYELGIKKLVPDLAIGSAGKDPGQFTYPHGIGFAPDGSVYVADSRNNRIQHFSADGKLLFEWGTFADVLKGSAPPGTFNEPWDVKVGPDGSVYVADTFNFRIQKFSPDGKFINMWGYFGQAEKPEAFWGPRGLAFDPAGRLFVTDTGNKRIVVFTGTGEPVTSFGTVGFEQGQLDEPVGIGIDKSGNVYVVDTWNQRIQVFAPDAAGINFLPLRMWDVKAWFGQSLDNKPYLALDSTGNVYVTDPEGVRVLVFDPTGKFLYGLGDTGDPLNPAFIQPAGIAIDSQDRVWLTDATGGRLVRITVPKNLQLVPAPSEPLQISPTQ
jgi:DNA-binding beta-propeller fold protein YncE/4-amino-4-deoxy-L-arabinose transferase-like glycosyltransferase